MDLPKFFQKNSEMFVELLATFDLSALNDPKILGFLSSLASETDTGYNTQYGGNSCQYGQEWEDHFTDDFWTALLLFSPTETECTREQLVHIAWFFGKLAFLTPAGPKPFQESKFVRRIQYGSLDWTSTSIRDRIAQMQKFDEIGDEQQKDQIPLVSFDKVANKSETYFSEMREMFTTMFPIPPDFFDGIIL